MAYHVIYLLWSYIYRKIWNLSKKNVFLFFLSSAVIRLCLLKKLHVNSLTLLQRLTCREVLFSENGELKNALMVSSTTFTMYFSRTGSDRRLSRLLQTCGRVFTNIREEAARMISWNTFKNSETAGCVLQRISTFTHDRFDGKTVEISFKTTNWWKF